MISKNEPIDLEAILALFNSIGPITADQLRTVIDAMTPKSLHGGEILLEQNDPAVIEVVVLAGVVKSSVLDREGNDITLNFYAGPAIVSPAITRHIDGRSRVHLTALTEAKVVTFPAAVLSAAMTSSHEVHRWGESVLRADLIARAEKELAFAVLSGKERLKKFRGDFPVLEDLVSHQAIASYLGITPVTLSRLRKQMDANTLS